jgi:hypothetical protein
MRRETGESAMKRHIYFLILLLAAGAVMGYGSDKDALIALYNATGGEDWTDNTNWDSAADISAWYGVTVKAGRVTELFLRDNNLSGSIPDEIGDLTELEYLYLDDNNLSGPIPVEIGNLGNLERLYLGKNNLTGTIPSQLGALSNLKYLLLQENVLTGGIPEELGGLSKLIVLSLASNSLSGGIPNTLGNLENLLRLLLGSNELTGSIPEDLTALSGLETLYLEGNMLSGEIPGHFTQLTGLSELDLGYNALVVDEDDADLIAFLASKDSDWDDGQTIAPIDLVLTVQEGGSLLLEWTPVEFQAVTGGYRIYYSTTKGGPYTLWGETGDKQDSSRLITDLEPGTVYYFIIRTFTNPHAQNDNTVESENSAEAGASTLVEYTLTVQSLPGGGVYITVNPADRESESSGATPFERYYPAGTEVTLTAPETFDGPDFKMWQVNGTHFYQRELAVTMDHDITVTAIYKDPEIYVNRHRLNFAATTRGLITEAQEFLVGNRGGGSLLWEIASAPSWISTSPDSGMNSGYGTTFATAAANTEDLSKGTHHGYITITSPDASNSPQQIEVTLVIKSSTKDEPPFGRFDTPVNGSVVRGSIPVTGWVLDDIGPASVKLYREEKDNPGELAYIGDATFVEGARPDVEAAYPDYPMSYKAGWGYMLLTNFLPDGDGGYTLHAVAADLDGEETTLGTRTITVDNENAVKPFGAIDTPEQGGDASGNGYRNQGWVLTPLPNKIPEDGSTIDLYIDGVKVQEGAKYDIFRADIAGLFPGYANSEGALAYFDFDTAAYANGLHTIAWTAEDNAGNKDGIGSRYFIVRNVNNGSTASTIGQIGSIGPIGPIRPIKKSGPPVTADEKGVIAVHSKELELLEIDVGPGASVVSPLPVGSTFDPVNGVFYWQPGPGFVGAYEFEFAKSGGRRVFLRVFIGNR